MIKRVPGLLCAGTCLFVFGGVAAAKDESGHRAHDGPLHTRPPLGWGGEKRQADASGHDAEEDGVLQKGVFALHGLQYTKMAKIMVYYPHFR